MKNGGAGQKFRVETEQSPYSLYFGGGMNTGVTDEAGINFGATLATSLADTTSAAWSIEVSGDQDTFSIKRGVNNGIGNAVTWSHLFRVDSNGDVGIGIGNNDAETRLEVAGAISGSIIHATKDLSSSGTLVTEGRSTLNGVAVFNEDASATSHVRMEGGAEPNLFFLNAGTDQIGIGTSSPKGKLDVHGSLSGSSFFGAGLGQCNDPVTSKLLYDSTTGTFSCGTDTEVPDMYRFIDTTSDPVVDNNTTDYWDTSAENNNSYPNITPSSSNHEVLVLVTIEIQSTGTADVEPTLTVKRSTGGVDPTCSDTEVGPELGTFSSNTNGTMSVTSTFVDSPVVATNVRYTVCADTHTSGTTANVLSIRFVLYEVNNVGADVAELYPTDDSSLTTVGSVVSIVTEPRRSGFRIRKNQFAYDPLAFGVVSTEPAKVIGVSDGTAATNVPIALAGRVPVLVTREGGDIRAGDYLTASSKPGYAMKATKPGKVIGQSLTAFDATDGEGIVTLFVGPSFFIPMDGH